MENAQKGTKEKGTIGIPGEYFLKMAKHDYRDYRQALPREFYQNSIDADASRIDVNTNSESRTIEITDNGCGMSRETLLEKLLVLGGSEKIEGSVGAFGKAKELLFFSWVKYEITTKNQFVVGQGANYTIQEISVPFDGTHCVIYIQNDVDFNTLVDRFTYVAHEMETSTEIYVDGNKAECQYPKGEFRKSINIGDIFVNEDINPTGHAKVRINGIWMFDWYVGTDTPHITMELNGQSVDYLTSNRDGLNWGVTDEANKFFSKLAADRRSTLFPDKEEIILHAKGLEGEQILVSDDDLSYLEERFGNMDSDTFMKSISEFIAVTNEVDKKLAKARVRSVGRYDYEQLKYFGFKWDTKHKFERGKEREAKNFLDGSQQNAKRAKALLMLWGETLKQVLMDTRKYIPFTVGYIWDENHQARLEREDGYQFFLNPIVLEEYPLRGKKKLVKKLKQLAVHEITHIHHEYHDEFFMNEMENIESKTWDSEHLYEQISKITM